MMASPLGLEPRISDADSCQHIHDAQLVCDLVRLFGVENLLARPTPEEHFVVAALVACFAYSRRATAERTPCPAGRPELRRVACGAFVRSGR